ncbi:LOW QUALITY PROTEIN: hypothetical protein Cgig2_009871 [Carnegiea gigantea]|uniref:Uncharacterized protein n=1 Tax=Carnegiea gigantea TaxID=171969 RepID=A0A9Q1KME8_9CARY|nr:LOW QUALITY PROTEIN: hypothetical protein Cgig2_009871 [Carnegiea gigantea]
MVKLGSYVCNFNVDLDRYQMIDLHQDAYVRSAEYFGFVFCPPDSKRKLLLQSDEDWRALISIWEYSGGKILIYMPALSTPTMYHFIVQQLQPVQVALTMQPVESVVALSINKCGNDFGTIEMEDQPRGYLTMIMMESFGKAVQEGLMIVILMIVLIYARASEEECCDESWVDLDKSGSNDGSNAGRLLNVDLEDEIPRHIDANAENEDGNPTKNESFALQRIKNNRFRHITVCKVQTYGFTSMVTKQLMVDFKANPTMQAGNI